MQKTFRKAVSLMLAVLVAVAVSGCKPPRQVNLGDDNMAVLEYPEFERTPGDKNSWEYIEEEATVEWYVDVSSWPIPTENDVVRKIKEATGITVKLTTPVSDDGQKLSAMIAGDDLPDVLSVATSNTKLLASLAQQGYVYDINTLTERWAPTLKEHLPQDVLEWWSYKNGKTYGIPNHYYSYRDIPEGQLQPNGGMMVRKDIFDAWQAYVEAELKDASGNVSYTSMSGETKSVPWQGYITTPEGFKQAAAWALENYGGVGDGQITTGLQLSQFVSGGSASLDWLAQFFAVPFEDRDGNYRYMFTSEGYEQMLYYLNDLFNTKAGGLSVLSTANFTQNYDGVGAVVAGGKAFATLVTPQDYQMHFVTAKDSGYEYISMYLTNENGDAPVLADIRGYGYLFNMITTSCQRPDLVIKLFDYLTSPEGQRLVGFGVEGETWNWTDEAKTEIAYTQEYLKVKADKSASTAKFGILSFDLLLNYQYYDNMQPKVDHGKTEDELYRTNLKRPLGVYAYDYNATHFIIDAGDSRFQEYNNAATRVDSAIGQQLPKIIKAADRAAAKKLYDQTVTLLNNRNLSLVIEMNAEAYKATKEKLGLTVAWPAYQEGYVSPLDRTKPNGDLSLYRSY